MENPFEIILERLERNREALIKEINRNGNQIEKASALQSKILNVSQTAEYLFMAIPTLYGYTSKREIPHYKMGKRIYFKKAELDEWITKSRVKTKEEIEKEAGDYLSKRRKFKR